ncbi:VPLPA-CTERM protein sorting domain-containing protein [Nonomuraea solani]|uniref:VPLPA-CTERM protein sorting domain-containing protein n=2 Tax=Nonomuraea solani TaxID=1144553 RepID=A0A1H6EYJ4_9ACTN|nr:VPLPA-CTERM protein sorting domain-containing protein [Nonomuraea solani]
MVRLLTLLSLVTALLILPVQAAGACSCAQRTPQQYVADAETVFTGTVTHVRVDEPMLNGGRVVATLRADHVYKGEQPAEVQVVTHAQSAACGYHFAQGARYLVFARAENAEVSTTSCDGNQQVPAGDEPLRQEPPELIAALGTPKRVVAAPPAPEATNWTGPAVIVLVAAALAGLALVRRRRKRR